MVEQAASAAPVLEGPTSEAEIRGLGLDPQLLVAAVLASEIQRRSVSRHAPSLTGGFTGWSTACTHLAETLEPQGWRKVETHGLPRVINPANGIAVAVCTGGPGVGRHRREPEAKHPRGSQTASFVRTNRQVVRQIPLFQLPPQQQPVPPDDELLTWWLLIYSGPNGILRAELSLPVAIDDDQFSKWEKRLFLDIPAPEPSEDTGAEPEPPTEFEIDVIPRA